MTLPIEAICPLRLHHWGSLMALALLAYVPCLNGPPLWDDTEWLGSMDWNLHGIPGLWRLWTMPESVQQYYPVTTTSFWVGHQLWGRWTLPSHLVNVLLHGGSCVWLWLLLLRLRVRGAWFAAALFAVHPVMVESVAWITERKNVLCTFFSLIALLLHGASSGWWESRRAGNARMTSALAFLFFVAAMLSKISAAVLPGVVLVIGWWRCGQVRWRLDGLRMLPWLAAVVPLALLTFSLEQAQIEGGDLLPALASAQRLLLACQLPWFYLGKLIWPQDLCVLYEKWPLQADVGWQWVGGAVLAAVLGLAMWRRWRGALAVNLLFLGTLLPVLGLLDVNGMKYAWAADRWVYLPAIAVFAGAGQMLHRVREVKVRRGIASVVLLACSLLCARQAALYSSVDRFWRAAIADSRTPWKAQNDYASQLMDEKRYDEARQYLEAALKIYPEYASALVNLGNALHELGKPDAAIELLDRAVALHPNKGAVAFYNKSVILQKMGRAPDAETALRAAIERRPDFFAAHNDLGNLLLINGRYDDAIECFNTLLKLRPGNAKALTSIGNIHFLRGDSNAALASYAAALRDDPDMVSTLANAAWILATSSDEKLRNGKTALNQVLHAADLTQRRDPSILQVLAAAHAESGEFEQAVAISVEAADLARAQGKESLATSTVASQELFEKQQPFRVPAR